MWIETIVRFGVGVGCGALAHQPASRAFARSIMGYKGIAAYGRGDWNAVGVYPFALGMNIGFLVWAIGYYWFRGRWRGSRGIGKVIWTRRVWCYLALHICSVLSSPPKYTFCPSCERCGKLACGGCALLKPDEVMLSFCLCEPIDRG